MPKKSFDDIVPPKKRSIRNIKNSHTEEQRSDSDYSIEYNNTKRTRPFRFAIWFVVLIIIVILVLAFSLLFSGAKVIVTPKQSSTVVDAHFTTAINADIDELSYEIMTIEKSSSKKIPASGKEKVEERASGNIIIYNNFNSLSQRLIKNTRFETPEGFVYRINKSVVVPGQSVKDGEKVPGSIEVTVYADEMGEKYNIGLVDFTIPGFKGSPRFDGFYARSKTSMEGGFEGEKLIADPIELKNAQEELRIELKKQITSEAFSQKPDNFYLFEDTIFVEFESAPTQQSGDEIEVIEKAVLYGALFNKEEFAKYLAKNTIASSGDESVEIFDINTLTLIIPNKEDSRPWEDREFKFELKGNVRIIWVFDEDKLKQDLSGRAKKALITVLSGYPSIKEAEVVLIPFWKRSFPDDINKIKIQKKVK